MRTFIFSAFLCGAAFAQVGGPFLGFVPDGTRIRPMHGLPGAGAIGLPIDAGRDFAYIAIAPTQSFAVAIAASTGEAMIVRPGISHATIKDASANPDILAVSPHGTSAALWFPLLGRLEVVSGLPDTPSVRAIDASFLNASPLSIAISDDGQWAAALFSEGVYAFGPSGVVIPLQTDPGVVALAFFHNLHDLALATSTRVTSIADIGGSMRPSVLYDFSAQALSPRAVALSFDNQSVVVAGAAGTLLHIALATGTANFVDCACSPTGLYGLGGALFRLNGTARKSELKLFDAATGAIWIVPPALSEMGVRQ